MIRAFVAGATGYTGRAVVAELRSRELSVLAHVRPDSSKRAAWTERWQALGAEVEACPWTLEAMSEALARWRPSHVFSLLGTTRSRMKKSEDPAAQSYEAVDYGLTALLIEAAAGLESRPRFIYLSSAGVAPGSRNPYMEVRWRAEEKLRACGLPYLIARPSFITGPDRDESRPEERFAAAATDAVLAGLALFGGGKLRARYRSTTNTVLARALVRAALDPELENDVLESERLR